MYFGFKCGKVSLSAVEGNFNKKFISFWKKFISESVSSATLCLYADDAVLYIKIGSAENVLFQ